MRWLARAAATCAGLALAFGAAAQAPDSCGRVSAWSTAMQDPLPAGFPAGNPALNLPLNLPRSAAMFNANLSSCATPTTAGG